jgi:glutamine synthetase
MPRYRGSGLAGRALDALEADHEFLLAGGVFSEGWSTPGSTTSGRRVDVVASGHPAEFALYYDC